MGRGDEWFYDYKFSNIKDHEMLMQGISEVTLFISTIIHIINGCRQKGGKNEALSIMMNIVSKRFYKIKICCKSIFSASL